MTYHRSSRTTRSQNLHPSMAKLQSKLARIVSRHDQLKISFNHLKSHIKFGLLEAEDVFSSLAVPLMKLVDLKTAEMAEEGRSSTIFMKIRTPPQGEYEDMTRVDMRTSFSTAERECDIRRLEEDYTNSALMAGKELILKQKSQLIQLVQLLKQVESCVNSSQKNMFQTIDDHKDHINMFLKKAVTYVSVVQQSSQDGHAFNITLKLLKAIYDHVREVFSSVEGGVDNLINKLTEQMCQPMIEYVKTFKSEMTTGTCPRLLVALEDMRGVAKDGRAELEQARKQVRVAEERKLEALRMLKESEERKHEALSMLKESEERTKKMRQYLDLFINDKKESTTHSAKNKEDQIKDDKLLWELLKKKSTCQEPASPFGPKELLPVGTSTKHQKPTMAVGTSTKHQKPTLGKQSITHRPTTRAYGRLNTRSLDSFLPLGSSPSMNTRKVSSYKR